MPKGSTTRTGTAPTTAPTTGAGPDGTAGDAGIAPKVGRPRSAGGAGSGDPRRDVLGAAGRLFFAKGVAATSMAEIAHAAGLQPPSLYYWFKSKTAILGALVADANRIPLDLVAQVNRAGGPAGERLWTIIQLDVIALSALPFDINEVHRLVSDDSPEAATYWAERRQLIAEIEAIVVEGMAAGEFRPVDPRLTALSILANDEGAQNWHRPVSSHFGPDDGAGYTPARIGEFLADLTLRGLLARPSRLDGIRTRATRSGLLPT